MPRFCLRKGPARQRSARPRRGQRTRPVVWPTGGERLPCPSQSRCPLGGSISHLQVAEQRALALITRVCVARGHEARVSGRASAAHHLHGIHGGTIRAEGITCTNAFDRLPRPTDGSASFCAPLPSDVCSPQNLARIAAEIHPQHSVALVCGISAYLVVTGNALNHPSKREYTVLTADELNALNTRLNANLRRGWYMGHTRRWSLKPYECSQALQAVASVVGWERCRAN
jgi:hypothetical protein